MLADRARAQSDSQLAAGTRLKRRSAHAASARAIEVYGPDVLGYLRIALDDDQAANAAFEAFMLAIWRDPPNRPVEFPMRVFVYRLAYRSARSLSVRTMSSRVRQPRRGRSLSPTQLATRQPLDQAELACAERLRSELSLDDRTLLTLRLDRGFTWSELAQVLQDTPTPRPKAASMRSRYQRLRRRLQRMAHARGLFARQAPQPDADARTRSATADERALPRPRRRQTPADASPRALERLLHAIALAQPAEPEVQPATPRRLGRYALGPVLGRGGMGMVYRARDLELDREVAVKLLYARVGGTHLLRFAREVRALSLLSHPNVVAIHDAAVHRGTPYLVMELVEGQTLRQVLLKRSRLPLPEVRSLARQLADALAAAHARGIVHRDLKPDNVIVCESGHIKVLDFGLAQLNALGSDPSGQRATVTGAVLGTPHYMSPEQVRGERVTPRSDLFAFGALLYELLSGRRAFGARSAALAYAQILGSQPPGLARRSRNAAREPLMQIARRCLHKDPSQRFASGRELAAALGDTSAEPWMGSPQPQARPRGAPREPTPRAGRRRVTRYATAGNVHIAYQVIGRGSVDVCFIAGLLSNLDVWWEQPPGRAFFGGLAEGRRLIMFDKRGSGLSDRVAAQTLDGRVDDLRAVLDAAGARSVVLFGDAGPTAIRFAARYPERTRALVFYGTSARSLRVDPQVRELLLQRWGSGVSLPIFAPSLSGDPRMVRWVARWERSSASPGALVSLLDALNAIDVSDQARSVRAPTLVLHRSGDRAVPIADGRALAQLIAGARFVELQGDDHAPMAGDMASLLEHVRTFVDALPPTP